MRWVFREIEYTSYRSWIFRRLLIIAIIITLTGPALDLFGWATGREEQWFRATSLANLIIVVLLVVLWRVHQRLILVAEIAFLLLIIVGISSVTYLYGGTAGSVPIMFMLPILATGLVLHPRLTFVAALVIIVLYSTMTMAELWGWIHPLPVQNSRAGVVVHITRLLAFAAQGFLGWMLAKRLLYLLQLAKARTAELQRHHVLLEAQVEERTADLARAAEAAKRRARQLALLNSTIRQIAGKLELDRLLAETVEVIRERFHYSNVMIMLIEYQPAPILVLSATDGILGQKRQIGIYRQSLDQGIIGYVARTGAPYLAVDVSQDPLFLFYPGQRQGRGTELAVPIKQGERVLGVLDVQSESPGSFTAEDQHTIEALAGQLAVAIEQARLYRAEQRARRWAETLYKTGEILSSSFDLKLVLPRLLNALLHMLSAERLGIYLCEEEEFRLAAVIDHLHDLPGLPERFWPDDLPLLEEMKRKRAPIYIDHTGRIGEFAPRLALPPGGCWIGAPLMHEERLMGLLTISNRRPGSLDPELLELVGTLAHQAAQAIVNAQLYQQRAEALSDLQRAQEELIRAERMRGLGELASGVAHDFNNLLACILGNAELLLLDETDEERRQLLEVMVRAARDGSGTVQRLREFARARRTETRQLISLAKVAEEALSLTRPRWWNLGQTQQRTIHVQLDLQPVDPVQANPTELREVMMNLILNAIDAMPAGGLLALRSWQEGDISCCSVSDSGSGIPAELQAKIFEPFFTTKGAAGTGLGLAVSAELIRHHGGTICLESAPGQGSTFTIRLPVSFAALRAAAAGAAAPDLEIERTGRLRVLVVDDEPEVCEALARIVRFLGHEACSAYSGEAALGWLGSSAFDVVFTDLGMPGISGWEVLRAAGEYDPAPAMVLVTGWGGQITEEEARAAGAGFLILKPFDLGQVRRIIGTAAVEDDDQPRRDDQGGPTALRPA